MAHRPRRRGQGQGRRPRALRSCPRRRRYGVPQARVVETLGNPQDQRRISLIAVHAHGLPDEFPRAVLRRGRDAAAPPTPAGRTDLRALPAPDHRPRRRARPRRRGACRAGHRPREQGRLDRPHRHRRRGPLRAARHAARPRGAPARQLGVLPRPGRADAAGAHLQRPVLAAARARSARASPCASSFDRHGNKKSHAVLRGIMRSAAKLAYEEAQAAIDGQARAPSASRCSRRRCEPLWGAYAALAAARDRRAPLDLDLPERKVLLDGEGRVERVVVPERLAAHRLIEEFMIQANVAVAEVLEAKRAPVIYRVHDAPSKEKIVTLREFLDSLDLKLPSAGSAARRRLQQAAAARQGPARRRSRQRGGAALAVAGGLRRRQHRPLRPAPRPLRALHLADPALCRPHRAPLADQGPGARRRRPDGRGGRRAEGHRAGRSPMPSAGPWRPSARPSIA